MNKIKDFDIIIGTDANVSIKIFGELATSDFIELAKSKTHRNKFEKGQTDRFDLRHIYFGQINKIMYRLRTL